MRSIRQPEKQIRVVYIAGPFRGPTAWDIEQNVRRAEELALRVALAGAMPLCPHCNTRFFQGQGTDGFWLDGTLELLRRCDAIMLTSNWKESSGAKAEEAEARRLGLRVFHDAPGLPALRRWLRSVL